MIKTKTIFAVVVLLLLSQSLVAQRIVNPQDYDYWRELASAEQFYGAMRDDAISSARGASAESPTHILCGSSALAYILDPDNSETYVANIERSILERIAPVVVGNDAVTSSVFSHELFFALLALDVVGADLDKDVLEECREVLRSKIMALYIGKWDPHAWAMRMLWYKYIGDQESFAEAKGEWEIGLSEHFLDDGVSPAGSVYCIQRWTNLARTAKNLMADMMEYMGYEEYYSNPAMQAHQEFLFGYANSPFGRGIFFGDSRHTTMGSGLLDDDGYITSPSTLKAARFSPEAYKYSMWLLREAVDIRLSDIKLKGLLSNYIVMAGSEAKANPLRVSLEDGELSQSRIFDNYAALVSCEQSKDALHLAMQNLTGNVEYHTHHEVNALAMVGYGEVLLRNAGYDGPGRDVAVGDAVATFEYMHEMSESSNCVQLGGKQHTSKVGGGVVDGFSGYCVEYFSGSTGKDLPIEGCHTRDVVFMQPSEGVNGYYIVMDHLETNKPKEKIDVIWHPNSATMQEVAEGEYLSKIMPERGVRGPQLYSDNRAALTTFLATEPSGVEFKRVVNQESRRQLPPEMQTSYVADYMLAGYTARKGEASILTVLFPSDKHHSVGELSRVVVGEYTGAKIAQNKSVDIALTSGGTTAGAIKEDRVSFLCEDLVYRLTEGRFDRSFTKGLAFKCGAIGFEAALPVAIHLNWVGGKLEGVVSASQKTTMKIYWPSVKGVTFDGEEAKVVASAANWLEVELPEGKFDLRVR